MPVDPEEWPARRVAELAPQREVVGGALAVVAHRNSKEAVEDTQLKAEEWAPRKGRAAEDSTSVKVQERQGVGRDKAQERVLELVGEAEV